MIKNSTMNDYYNCKFGCEDNKFYAIVLNYPTYHSIVDDKMINRIILPPKIIKLIDDEVTLLCMAKCDPPRDNIFEGYSFLGGEILIEDQKCNYGHYIETHKCIVLCTEDKNIFSKVKLLN